MQASTKKLIAREWLTLVICIVIGLTIAPIVVIAAFHKQVQLSMLGSFYESLFSREWQIAWLVALSPYLIYQFVRSVRWAVRTTHENG